MPILLQNYNLPPEIRTHLTNLICVGIIPDNPSDIASFMIPLDNELALLAYGVRTFDPINQEHFDLHGYVVVKHGDLLAIAKMLGIKGVNGFSPCRSCNIKGIRNMTVQSTTYYAALTTPEVPHQTRSSVDPRNLDHRQHSDFGRVLDRMAEEARPSVKAWLAIYHGIREPPALTRVKSINFARSIAWDWTHLFCENIIPKLHELWTNRYPLLGSGHFEYVIPPAAWNDIGKETAEAIKNIPASFVRVLGSIGQTSSGFTAESWAFWFMYVAPIVLKGRFPKKCYYKHALALSKIMKTTLKYEITRKEIDELEEEIVRWVEKYEKYYYQYKEDRLAACTLPVHGLLHLASDIRYCGPVWTTWVFYIERFAGSLQAAVKSRVHPWSNLARRNLHLAYLAQLTVKYDLHDELMLVGTVRNGSLTRGEMSYPDYPNQILRPPYTRKFALDQALKMKIGTYLVSVLGGRRTEIAARLPPHMAMWGKMRIRGGDAIRTSSAFRRTRHLKQRDNTCIRYDVVFDGPSNEAITQINYGVLDKILVCPLDPDPFWGPLKGKTLVLALITPFKTNGANAALEVIHYRARESPVPVITDLRNVISCVGRVESRGKFGLIDRDIRLVRPTFTEGEMNGLDSDESDGEL